MLKGFLRQRHAAAPKSVSDTWSTSGAQLCCNTTEGAHVRQHQGHGQQRRQAGKEKGAKGAKGLSISDAGTGSSHSSNSQPRMQCGHRCGHANGTATATDGRVHESMSDLRLRQVGSDDADSECGKVHDGDAAARLSTRRATRLVDPAAKLLQRQPQEGGQSAATGACGLELEAHGLELELGFGVPAGCAMAMRENLNEDVEGEVTEEKMHGEGRHRADAVEHARTGGSGQDEQTVIETGMGAGDREVEHAGGRLAARGEHDGFGASAHQHSRATTSSVSAGTRGQGAGRHLQVAAEPRATEYIGIHCHLLEQVCVCAGTRLPPAPLPRKSVCLHRFVSTQTCACTQICVQTCAWFVHRFV
jgi:hypothetical protein